MNLKGLPESKNFQDKTVPHGVDYLKTIVGNYLYRHGYGTGANGRKWDPSMDGPALPPMNHLPVDDQGRRADIDWGSNAGMPGASLMGGITNPDAMARKLGFKNAAQAAAYYQKQREQASAPARVSSGSAGEASASSGSLLDRVAAIHPKVLLGHVLDAFGKAGQ